MLINTLPSLPTQSNLQERFQSSTAQSVDESPQAEQSPRIVTTSSVDNRFQGIVALFGYDNLSGARSRIVDVDFAQETSNLTKNQILQQAGVAMLSQANSQPQAILALLDR